MEATINSLREYMQRNPEGYRLDASGAICSPGKFEGETLAAPYFYGQGCEGCADIDTGRVFGFKLTDDERALLQTEELYFYIEESDSGFIYTDFGSDPDADIVDDPMEEAEDAYSMHTDWTPTEPARTEGGR